MVFKIRVESGPNPSASDEIDWAAEVPTDGVLYLRRADRVQWTTCATATSTFIVLSGRKSGMRLRGWASGPHLTDGHFLTAQHDALLSLTVFHSLDASGSAPGRLSLAALPPCLVPCLPLLCFTASRSCLPSRGDSDIAVGPRWPRGPDRPHFGTGPVPTCTCPAWSSRGAVCYATRAGQTGWW